MSDVRGHAGELAVLRARAGWAEATEQLRVAWQAGCHVAEEQAREYGLRYRGRRGSMIVDVVASQQRQYNTRVRHIVEAWQRSTTDRSIGFLAHTRPADRQLGLRAGEADTMTAVAEGLRRFASDHNLDGDDDACRAWADSVAGLEHAYELDPYVGAVKGIGLALFGYLRMRCGADALKPDVRVRQALNAFGYNVPNNPHAVLTVARAAAAELGTTLLVLDQLLWIR